jgi:hypothetical protein
MVFRIDAGFRRWLTQKSLASFLFQDTIDGI